MDNVYCQIIGHKRAVLWSPSQVEKLYMVGDKSRVVDIDNSDLDQFPLFAHAQKHVAELIPGDILFIPALWFHNMFASAGGVCDSTRPSGVPRTIPSHNLSVWCQTDTTYGITWIIL